MSITLDWANKIVNSTASITDIPAFRTTLRGFEDSETGILYAPIITYKKIDLGGGATFPAIAFINNYQLQFPNAGNYEVKGGNLNATIITAGGVFVDRTQSAAYAVTTEGAGGIPEQDKEDIANKVMERGVLTVNKFIAFK